MIEKKTRTEYAIKNIKFTILAQILNILLNFITRSIFLRTLGIEYLGIEGLFTNVLTLLSMAEMGVGSAVAYSLYAPIAENDYNKIYAILKYFSKIYTVIAITIFSFGSFISLTLDFWIKKPATVDVNLQFVFFLFLLNTSVSYLYAHKKTFIIALQKSYLVTTVHQILRTTILIFQTFILLKTQNYYLYLLLQIGFTLIENITIHVLSLHICPLKKANLKCLTKQEVNKIYSNIKALFKYKIASSILNGTDNIIISRYIGISSVGILINYVTITNLINGLIGQIFDSLTATIGNLNTTESTQKQYHLFKNLFWINAWIYSYIFVILFFLFNPFLDLWLGTSYHFPITTVITIISSLYLNGIHTPLYIYRSTLGFFVYGQNIAILAAVLNIVLSIIVAPHMGVSGVLLVTIFVRLLLINLVDAFLVFNKNFRLSFLHYYLMNIPFIVIIIFSIITCLYLSKFVCTDGILNILFLLCICTIIYHFYMVLYICIHKEFRQFIIKLKTILFNNFLRKV